MIGRGLTFPILILEVQEALTKNRAEHLEIVEEAQKGFRKKVIDGLDAALKDARDGVRFCTSLQLQMPQSHTREFDNAIEYLGAIKRAAEATGSPLTIALSADEYERFVRNKWDWMQGFAASSAMYSAKAQKMYEAM